MPGEIREKQTERGRYFGRRVKTSGRKLGGVGEMVFKSVKAELLTAQASAIIAADKVRKVTAPWTHRKMHPRLHLSDAELRVRHRPTYSSWKNMIRRCTNRNDPSWWNYGALGVKVCERWMDFRAFLVDMGERPVILHRMISIDRIDPLGNYEPGNCRWAIPRIQANNKREHARALAAQKRPPAC